MLEIAEAKEDRVAEADVRRRGLARETVDDFKEMDRILYQLLVTCMTGEAQNYVCKSERSGCTAEKQMVSHFDQEQVKTDLWRTRE